MQTIHYYTIGLLLGAGFAVHVTAGEPPKAGVPTREDAVLVSFTGSIEAIDYAL